MKTSFFKTRRDVSIEEIKNSLEKKFLEFEYIAKKKQLIMKKSMFVGAKVFYGMGRIIVKHECPTLIGDLVDDLCLGMISTFNNRKIALNVLDHLKDEFGYMESLK